VDAPIFVRTELVPNSLVVALVFRLHIDNQTRHHQTVHHTPSYTHTSTSTPAIFVVFFVCCFVKEHPLRRPLKRELSLQSLAAEFTQLIHQHTKTKEKKNTTQFGTTAHDTSVD
jgi:Na+/H+ antiporter NhaD/arsenite permease-like protein